MKKLVSLLLFIVPVLSSFAKEPPAMPRMSFSEVADSTLTTPEIVFKVYNKDLNDYDVNITIPEDYHPVDRRNTRFFISRYSCWPSPQSFYPLALESDDCEAMFLYPTLFFDHGNLTLRKGLEIEAELRAAYEDCELDINPYVDIYDVRNMNGFANADTVAIYEFKLDSIVAPAIDTQRYKHCIGVYLRSKKHPALLLKIALSDKAYPCKDKYIRLLLDNVEFGDINTRLSAIETQLTNIYTDLCFPTIVRWGGNSLAALQPVMDELPEKYKDRSSEDPQK